RSRAASDARRAQRRACGRAADAPAPAELRPAAPFPRATIRADPARQLSTASMHQCSPPEPPRDLRDSVGLSRACVDRCASKRYLQGGTVQGTEGLFVDESRAPPERGEQRRDRPRVSERNVRLLAPEAKSLPQINKIVSGKIGKQCAGKPQCAIGSKNEGA